MRRPIWRQGRARTIFVAILLMGGMLTAWSLAGGSPPAFLSLAEPIVYQHHVGDQPRRHHLHVVWIDLDDDRVEFLVTPPADPATQYPFIACPTLEFLRRHDLLVAVNGDYFQPHRCSSPFSFYPRRGDPVAVLGPSISQGVAHVPEPLGYFANFSHTVYISADRQIGFGQPRGEPHSAISGGPILLRDGQVILNDDEAIVPQTAVGYDRDANRLCLVVVDGRQPGYSEGLTSNELSERMRQMGIDEALRLDGGGSSTLAVRNPQTQAAEVFNRPIHGGIPGWQRPVANHLGVRLRPSSIPLGSSGG